MVKCLQCGAMTVYMDACADSSRCTECKGITIPYGECRLIEPAKSQTMVLYANGIEYDRVVYYDDCEHIGRQ